MSQREVRLVPLCVPLTHHVSPCRGCITTHHQPCPSHDLVLVLSTCPSHVLFLCKFSVNLCRRSIGGLQRGGVRVCVAQGATMGPHLRIRVGDSLFEIRNANAGRMSYHYSTTFKERFTSYPQRKQSGPRQVNVSDGCRLLFFSFTAGWTLCGACLKLFLYVTLSLSMTSIWMW